jgi:putative exporter of polyketide antibiotics
VISTEKVISTEVTQVVTVLISSVLLVVSVSLAIDVKVEVKVATKKVENVVSTHMVVAYEVVDSSNVTVDIVGVFPFVGNCAWVVESSKFKVLFSTDEMKSLAAVVSQ